MGVCLLSCVACGPGLGAGPNTATATSAQASASLAYKGEECHAVWQRPKDADGKDLPWDSAAGVGGPPWTKGPALTEGTSDKLITELVCFDAIASDDTVKRHARFDDRRLNVIEAAILVDECVESGRCTSADELAGIVTWYAHAFDQTRLSSAISKLELSQAERDAFESRTVANIGKLDAFVGTFSPAQRAYEVQLPNDVRNARATYYKSREDAYGRFDRILDKLDHATAHNVDPTIAPAIVALRSEAVVRCTDATQCTNDPLFVDTSRALVRAYVLADQAFEAKAQWQILGASHANRATVASQIWMSQSAYRKLHPEVKVPVEVTEEGVDPTVAMQSATIELVRGEVATIAPSAGGTSKISFKDPAPSKKCEDTSEIDRFDGTSMESMRIVYKQACSDVPAPPKIAPLLVASAEVTKLKPPVMVIAVATGTGATRKGMIARALVGDKVVQLGADHLAVTSGDPLK